MSQPKKRARRTEQVVPGIHRWSVEDDRIGGVHSEAYAVVSEDGAVTLIDPLPIAPDALSALGRVEAIVLTAGNHQRAAWSLRKTFGAPVWAPLDAHGLEDSPDATYTNGDNLPGGLMAYHTPGPAEVMFTLWKERPRSVVFLSDLLTHDEEGTPRFVDSQYQDDPARTRVSVRRILEHLPVEVVCFAHGRPILEDGAAALRQALSEDSEFPAPAGA
ncbi:MBL fold metallo-hydrolase [Cystobacter ferrugineus]|uniref:MBL fold metallo-hydrolase n=1 Tax=Cystobacter ferrugineus TaxID=83449 RepID=A0A1L9BGJ0_9BACT|nr:MBL fold metallo-hydrolase [Cystobacter ferrugineus]OJH41370.1 MBL fold metallo-hydrolase [Cystobacter ferrugineus]